MPESAPQAKADLRCRTRAFALDVIRFCSVLPKSMEASVLGRQLIRSGTSVGANYREACRARSTAEFISKMEIALQELDESSYWIDLLMEGCGAQGDAGRLWDEADQLTSIFVASINTAKSRR